LKVVYKHNDVIQLVEACVKQNRSAQHLLYELLAPKMLSVCRSYVKDLQLAEDLMISGFLKVFLNLKNYKSQGSFEGWVRRIMVHECIDFIRVKKNNFNHQDIEDITLVENDSVYELENFLVDDIQNLIDNLPEGYKMVFNLYVIEGYKHQEIAQMLNISEGTSKSQLSHARKLLQHQIIQLNKKLNGTT
jgi:RNA polymerase sigma-70 factor, ECF subfamily